MKAMHRAFKQAASISEMGTGEFLTTLFGDIRSIEREPMKTVGFSGTVFERLRLDLVDAGRIALVLKHVHPEQDATVWRTGQVAAREARLLAERRLDAIWDVFDAPYLAYAVDGDVSSLLMRDLSDHLFPDVRTPINADHEEILIDSLARLHAAFWERSDCAFPWLAKGEFVYTFLVPGEIEREEARGRRHPLFSAVKEGWELALSMSPAVVGSLLNTPPSDLARYTDGLPRTLLHGDAKIANFALLPNGIVSAFDWAIVAEGCPSADIGWYLAVNASRLARSKEDLLDLYRRRLAAHRGVDLSDQLWRKIVAAAVLGGGMVLLWNKALNLKKGLTGAEAEWNWWVTALAQINS
jgi:hypothetical protein